jgi:hypothetical protein
MPMVEVESSRVGVEVECGITACTGRGHDNTKTTRDEADGSSAKYESEHPGMTHE